MTEKELGYLVVETSKLISEIFNHPEYQQLDYKGYESNATLGDAYQAMLDLNAQIARTEKEQE